MEPAPPTSSTADPSGPTRFPCGACGSALTFQPGKSMLECGHCGHQQPLDVSAPHLAVEHDFEAALAARPHAPSLEVYGTAQQYHCETCGANSSTDKKSDHCPFCGAPVVLQDAPTEAFPPETVLPFDVEKRVAVEAFSTWVKGLWFAPNALKKNAKSDRVDGVYIPYWTYDASTFTQYSGSYGIDRVVTDTDTDDEGNTTTTTRIETDWYPKSGAVSVAFDDVVVCASKSLPHDLIDKLEPWGLENLRPFDPAFLSGFLTERKAIELRDGYTLAQGKMDPEIHAAICRDLGGDRQQVHSKSVAYSDIMFKHFLCPVWMSSFRYNDTVYRFAVNGRTGELSGERPYSVAKIAAAVLTGLAVLGSVAYILSQQ